MPRISEPQAHLSGRICVLMENTQCSIRTHRFPWQRRGGVTLQKKGDAHERTGV